MKARIYADDGVRVEDECPGPFWTGHCSRCLPGAPVPCAGRKVLVLRSETGVACILRVERDAVTCPLAALNRG